MLPFERVDDHGRHERRADRHLGERLVARDPTLADGIAPLLHERRHRREARHFLDDVRGRADEGQQPFEVPCPHELLHSFALLAQLLVEGEALGRVLGGRKRLRGRVLHEARNAAGGIPT
jgi:hypothetical protein